MIESEENEEYEVEKIVAQRKNSDNVIEYKIRWKGFSPENDTWEPEINLIGCEEVLREFKLNNGLVDIKKDFEDGEVSESDSVHSDLDDNSYRKQRKSKKKKSKKRTNAKVKSESQQSPDIHNFNDEFGIKVEIGMDSAVVNQNKEKSQSFTPSNYSMGASELLLKYYNNLSIPSMEVAADFKQEFVDLTDDTPMVKEEKSSLFCFEQEKETIPERFDDNDDNNDSDSDLDGQLKVVINEEQENPQEKTIVQESTSSSSVLPSGKPKSWREQMDTVNFKIRKSQRKDDPLGGGNDEAVMSVLAKDKWTVKLKDSQTEAFYNLPVVQSLSELRLRVEKEILNVKSNKSMVSKEQIIKAIEDGNSSLVWDTLLCKEPNTDCGLNDGELLVLASRLGYCDIIGMIIRAGVDVNYQNEEGITPLMTACEYGHEIVCQLLINNGAHINFVNKKSESALLKVVTRGQKECLSILLQNGCDVFSLESEKSPLQITRQRNLHEMEVMITEYHKNLSDKLSAQFIGLMGSMITVSYILFPLRILSLYEAKEFVLEFDTKFPPVKEDECNLLIIFTGLVQEKQIQFCLEQIVPIVSVKLNEIDQQSLVPDNQNYLMSMSPILDGKNVLTVKFQSTVECRWVRSLAIGFRVKINPSKTV